MRAIELFVAGLDGWEDGCPLCPDNLLENKCPNGQAHSSWRSLMGHSLVQRLIPLCLWDSVGDPNFRTAGDYANHDQRLLSGFYGIAELTPHLVEAD